MNQMRHYGGREQKNVFALVCLCGDEFRRQTLDVDLLLCGHVSLLERVSQTQRFKFGCG